MAPAGNDSAAAAGRAGRGLAALAAPVVVGMVLRLWGLGDQVIGDDELHAVRAALAMPLGEILVTWRQTDHSLPLTALYRLWLDLGGHLEDRVLRLPPLLGSLGLLALAPRLALPLFGRRVAIGWAWALALAPLLVSYGRMVRSYSLVLALVTCGLLALARFWQAGGRRDAVAYAGCGAAAIFFHLGAGPIVAAPLVVGLAALALPAMRPRPDFAWRDALGPAAALLGLVAALLLPGAASLAALIEAKAGAGGFDRALIGELIQLHAGTRSRLLAAAFGAAVGAGPVLLWRRGRPASALVLGSAVLGQGVGLAMLAPELGSPTLLARALLVTLPFSLLAAVVTLDVLAASAARGRVAVRAAAIASVALAFVATGPWVDVGTWRTSFRHHDDHLVFTRARPQLGREGLPVFYREVVLRAAEAGERAGLVELPWHPFWGFGHAIPAYQQQHRQPVTVANAEPFVADARLALRSYVAAQPAALLATGRRYAVVHLDWEREERAARRSRPGPDPVRPHPAVWQALRDEGARLRRALDRAFGPPDYEDGVVAVWDLARVRSSKRTR